MTDHHTPTVDGSSPIGAYFWRKKTFLYYTMAVLVFILHCSSLSKYSSLSDTIDVVDDFITYRVCQVAVPMFFVLSGMLFFRNYRPEDYLKKLKKRVRTLVIPYLSWNAISVIFSIVTSAFLARYFVGREPFEWSFSSFFLGIFHYEYNLPCWFLFELIYFVLCTPVIDLLTREKYASPFLITALLLLDIPSLLVPKPLFMTPNAVIYYLIGAYIGRHWIEVFTKKAGKKRSLLGAVLIVLAVASECARAAGVFGTYTEIVRVLIRVIYVLGVWWFADLIVDRIQIRPFMHHSFMIFVLNVNVGAIVGQLVYMALPKTVVFAYVSFVITIVLTLLVIEAICVLMSKYCGRLYGFLNGSRA